ncbi:hypothetical protein JCM15764A_05660 [Geotalea toluenoxydans]
MRFRVFSDIAPPKNKVLQTFPGKTVVASGESDELQERTPAACERRQPTNSRIVYHYAGGIARSAAVATERTDDVATVFYFTEFPAVA